MHNHLLTVGDTAPDFTAQTVQGDQVHLYELLTHSTVVLFFLVKPFTPVCTMEACTFRDQIDNFLKVNATVLGVSADDIYITRYFSQFFDLPFTLLLDTNKRLRHLYGVSTKFGLLPSRVTFVIGQNRLIQDVISGIFNARRHVFQSLRSVQKEA
jgi:peroxiredoxin Q/BCP